MTHINNYMKIWKEMEKCFEDWTAPDSSLVKELRKFEDDRKEIVIEAVLHAALKHRALSIEIERTDR